MVNRMTQKNCICNIKNFSEESCTACRACEQICPKNAISFSQNSHGFLMPSVDETKCVDCGLCKAVCHLFENKGILFNKETKSVYAAKSKNETVRYQSSSGGVFRHLAEYIVKNGGSVYGAAFDESFLVKHIRVSVVSELDAFYGSKYLQSDVGNTFQQALNDLKLGKTVLYSGTPCQIAGIQTFMQQKNADIENLFLVEVVCHGVPSPLVWKEYLASRVPTATENIDNIYFRHKEAGWHARIKVRVAAPCFTDPHLDSDFFEDSDFNELFLSNLTLRECCHKCHYAQRNRVADITLCDFWGIENTELKDFDDDKGVSGVIIHSEKAEKLWNSVSDNFETHKIEYEKIYSNQQTMNSPFQRPSNKDAFWEDFYTESFKKVAEKYVEERWRSRSYKYVVLASDGSGSKGDEGMLRGILSILNYDNILLISPNSIYPCTDALLDIKDRIDEVCVPHEQIADAIKLKSKLIVVGADVIDGTCGVEYSLSRIAAMKKMLSLGGEVFCFSSFRSNVDSEIINGLNEITKDKNTHFFVRDEISKQNFSSQVNENVQFFPDFAFFCERINSPEVSELKKIFSEKKTNGATLIGINFSEPSFTSFYKKKNLENKIEYVTETLRTILREVPNAFFVLISNDIRKWEGHLSDSSYQILTENCLKKIGSSSFLTVSSEISYPELLELLSSIDYLVSARMHLSIAAIRSGTVPIVYTGNEKSGSFSMYEKVAGMLKNRLGRTDLLATNKQELINAIRVIKNNHFEIKKILTSKNEENSLLERNFLKKIRQQFCVVEGNNKKSNEIFIAKNTICELRQATFRYQNMNSEFKKINDEQNVLLVNKQAHIEQLIESERKLNGEVANKNAHIEQLLESERRLNAQIHDLDSEIRKRDSEISALKNSLSWRVTKPLRFAKKVVRKVYHVLVPHKLRTAIWIFRHKGMKGIKEHIEKKKYGQVLPEPITYRPSIIECVSYEKHVLPECDRPLASIVIPVYNQFDYTYKCILSILNTVRDISYEIIIADDMSTDETAKITEYFPNIRVNKNESDHGFLMNCNRAAKLAKGEFIVFLNNDTQVQENWLSSLVKLIQSDENIGMVGSKLVYPNGTLQEAGGIIWNDASGWNYGRGKDPELPEYNYVKEVDYISGASIMIRSSLWKEIGGFDERYKPAYYEDSDLAFEVRKHGFKVMYQPESVAVHFEGVSNGTDLTSGLKKYQVENHGKFVAKWENELKKQYSNGENVFFARERNYGKKVILIIDHYVPTFDKDAGSKTTFQYIKMFLEKGYAVKFVGDNYAYKEMEPYMSTLLQMGVEVLYGVWYLKNFFTWLKNNEKSIDFVYLNRPHITRKYIDFIREQTGIKIIYYGHDLHFFREQREYELTGNEELKEHIEKIKHDEFDIMHKADVVYYPSYLEEKAIKDVDPSINVKAINAYIFDSSKINVDYSAEKRNGILFVGGFSHTPNIDAVKWFAGEIFPKIHEKNPDINFYIAGANAPEEIKKLDGNGIVFKGFVTEEELSALYKNCRIVVVPLRYGAGVKGKVIEALYNGCPIVTTDIGAEGIRGIENIVEIHNEPDNFAYSIIRLYSAPEKLKEMSKKSTDFIKENFSINSAWNVIKEDF